MKRCVVLHQAVAAVAAADEQDTLIAAAAVATMLAEGDWQAEELALELDLAPAARYLREEPPALVFNLVESLPGVPFAGPAGLAAAALLEGLGLPFTGSPLAALALSSDKPAAKRALRAAGIPVPPGPNDGWPGPFILKHRSEHASFGLGPNSVVPRLPDELPTGLFAEAFLPGREFNVSLLAEEHGMVLLPPAELVYNKEWPPVGADAAMPRILDYAGKWLKDDPLYAATSRSFTNIDEELASRLAGLARRAFAALGLAGYGRVDFRLDAAGVPYVLEVNANPALAPDAGFAAAAHAAGIGYGELIRRIAETALMPPALRAGLRLPSTGPRRALPGSPLRKAQWEPADGSPNLFDVDPGPRYEAKQSLPSVAFRSIALPSDVTAIGALCSTCGFFSDAEIAVAEELVRTALSDGASGYRFLLAEQPHGLLLGYACFGPVPASAGAWDLYWIVVLPAAQGCGIGRRLVEMAAIEAAAGGGRILYAETAGRALYAPTRSFYQAAGFSLEAVLADFYAPGDAKQIWSLPLAGKEVVDAAGSHRARRDGDPGMREHDGRGGGG